MIGSGALAVVVLPEEDAVAQEVDACSSVHLPLEQLGLGVHALRNWPSCSLVNGTIHSERAAEITCVPHQLSAFADRQPPPTDLRYFP